MVIIKCNLLLKEDDFANYWKVFVDMAARGVILLPPGFELLNEVPSDEEVVVVKKKEAEE